MVDAYTHKITYKVDLLADDERGVVWVKSYQTNNPSDNSYLVHSYNLFKVGDFTELLARIGVCKFIDKVFNVFEVISKSKV